MAFGLTTAVAGVSDTARVLPADIHGGVSIARELVAVVLLDMSSKVGVLRLHALSFVRVTPRGSV